MTILRADFIMTMNEKFDILQNSAVAFDDKIVAVGGERELRDRFSDALFIDAGENSVLMPGLVNPHVHLEFSANKTTLKYGDFITWLKSVISHREELIKKCSDECIFDALLNMLRSGTTTIGAISSFGADLKSCVQTPLNVIYFNEILGSNPAMVDALFSDFKSRLSESRKYSKKSFVPAVSIHSPYSTHPLLAKKVLDIAKSEKMIVSTHFMESRAEREWIDKAEGDFAAFFEEFLPGSKPVNDPISYIELFRGVHTLFTHAVYANEKELRLMQNIGYITHCPVSNRLLGNGILDIYKVRNLTIGTDGLSSNFSLNLWDEMRTALFMHANVDLYELSKKLLIGATKEGAKSLKRESGEIGKNFDADIIILKLPDKASKNDLALEVLLHTKEAKRVYIGGIDRRF